MTKKNEPKIRMVSLKNKSLTMNKNNQVAKCHCEGDDNCPECRVQPMCSCDDDTCACHPICSCDPIEKPCVVDPPPCRTVIPTDKSNNQLEQQTPKEGKENPRTFFKIAENK